VHRQAENRMNIVKRWFSWLSEKICVNATAQLVEIHENDIFQSIIVNFDANCFELIFSINHRPNISFNWLGCVMDGTVEYFTKGNTTGEVRSFELVLELHESDTAMSLLPEQSVATSAGSESDLGWYDTDLWVSHLVCNISRIGIIPALQAQNFPV